MLLKRIIASTLVCALLALVMIPALACADVVEMEQWRTAGDVIGITWIGRVNPESFDEYVQARSDALGMTAENSERLIEVQVPFGGLWLRVPDEGPDAEAYYRKGVRFIVDESSFGSEAPEALSFDDVVIAERPTLLETVGENAYAWLDAVQGNELMLTLIGGFSLGADGEQATLRLNKETMFYTYNEQRDPATLMIVTGVDEGVLAPGSSYDFLYDPDTLTVVAMWEANG